MLKDAGVKEYLAASKVKHDALSISDYMQIVLYGKHVGFYEKSEIKDHFVTPLTLNSGFLYFLIKTIMSDNQSLLEIGPSHGILAQELLKNNLSTQCFLFEKSFFSQQYLKDKFNGYPQVQILSELPVDFQGLIYLQEILDCQPANWYCWQENELVEYFLDPSFQVKVRSKDLVDDLGLVHYLEFLKKEGGLRVGDHFLFSSQGTSFFKTLLKYKNSKILLVDYGYLSRDLLAANRLVKSPLRAYQQHRQIEKFWPMIGQCDITYDVDFSWYLQLAVSQGIQIDFYGTLAQFIMQNSQNSDYDPLLKPYLDPRQLGECFKVALLTI